MPESVHAHNTGAKVYATPDGRFAVSWALDGFRVWDVGERKVIQGQPKDDAHRAATLSIDGKTLVFYDSSVEQPRQGGNHLALGMMGVCDRPSGDIVWGITNAIPKWMQISPDGRYVVNVSTRPTLTVWDVMLCKDIAVYTKHREFITGAAILADGRRVASTGYDRSIHIWDMATGDTIRELGKREHHWALLGAAAEGSRLITVEGDYHLNLWDVETGERVGGLRFPRLATCVALTPDGKFALVGTPTSIALCDLEKNVIVNEIMLGRDVTGCAAAGNQQFIVADEKGRIAFYGLDELIAPTDTIDSAWSSLSSSAVTSPTLRGELISQIEHKYHFLVPKSYVKLQEAGILSGEEKYWLSDVEWFSLQEMYEYEDSALWVKLAPMVTFAKHDGGQFCWWPAQATKQGIPVVECNRIEESCFLAPNFESFVYRKVIEYAAGAWIADTAEQAVEQLGTWLQIYRPMWPDDYVSSVMAIIEDSSTLTSKGEYDGLISWEKCQEILSRDLQYDRLNEVFECYASR